MVTAHSTWTGYDVPTKWQTAIQNVSTSKTRSCWCGFTDAQNLLDLHKGKTKIKVPQMAFFSQ